MSLSRSTFSKKHKGNLKPFELNNQQSNFNVSIFIVDSEKCGFIGLAGHRNVGALRASNYNGLTIEACQALVTFMKQFQKKYQQKQQTNQQNQNGNNNKNTTKINSKL